MVAIVMADYKPLNGFPSLRQMRGWTETPSSSTPSNSAQIVVVRDGERSSAVPHVKDFDSHVLYRLSQNIARPQQQLPHK